MSAGPASATTVPTPVPWHLDDRMRQRTIDGALWSYVDTGGGPDTIVLLPGSVGTCEVFFKQIAALGREVRIVAATYPALTDPAALADGLAAFLRALDLNGALIAGSSFAAYWLQFFGLRHPDRVHRLLLGNGFVEGAPLRSHPLFDPALVENASAETLQDTWRARIAGGPDSELKAIQLDMLSGRQSAATLRTRLVSVIAAEPCPERGVADDRIILLDCLDDPIITPSMRDAMAARYPRAVRHTLPTGGHYPHLLDPEGYNALLRKSLGSP